MEEKERYKHLNRFLKEKLGKRTLKICIDGGFTCPNRDGTVGHNGCIFCSEKGSGEHICNIKDISMQVKQYFRSYKAERANQFIAYFQNFTNTYDSVSNLKLKYDAALIDERIVALAVATRPDCITEEIAKLLQSYSEKYYVWVELGLQTSNDQTGNLINRGFTAEQFSKAVSILRKYKIDVVTHIMVGLPNECFVSQSIPNALKDTIDFINCHDIQGLKIHSTYVIKNTNLAYMYENNLYKPLSLDEYLKALTYILTNIRPDIIIHRLSGDAPKDLLIAPEWNLHKKWIINGIDNILRTENLYQGMYYMHN